LGKKGVNEEGGDFTGLGRNKSASNFAWGKEKVKKPPGDLKACLWHNRNYIARKEIKASGGRWGFVQNPVE